MNTPPILTPAERHAAMEYNLPNREQIGHDLDWFLDIPLGEFLISTFATTASGVEQIAQLQRMIGATADGAWGPKSSDTLERYRDRIAAYGGGAVAAYGAATLGLFTARRYGAPEPEEQHKIMDAARRWLGFPETTAEEREAWAYVIGRESGGWVGRPNYTADQVGRYREARVDKGARFSNPANANAWAVFHADIHNAPAKGGIPGVKSSAVGIGQLLVSNMDRYSPTGRHGVGDALAEFAAMDAYMRARYGGPVQAAQFYVLPHCPDDRRSYYSDRALAIGCKPGEGY